ncbi:MAG: DUF927 domain-containing protein [Xanthobacteraceae bacterium]|nr:DUF927 domain-containing protein [Xanthobacteraceae bacterium]
MKIPYLKLTQTIEDEKTGDFELSVEFETVKGKTKRLVIGRDESDAALHRLLRKKGAKISRNLEQAKPYLSALAKTEHTVPSAFRAANIGWRASGAFVLPTRILGKSSEDDLVPPKLSHVSAQWPMKAKGTVEEWKSAIKPTQFSSVMMLCATLPFAAAMLRHSGRSSFGILLYGNSKRGKSTATLVCSSALGIFDELDLPTFNSTDAALDQLPACFNDLPTPINELGSSVMKGVALADMLQNFSYKVGDSKGRQYSEAAIASGVVPFPLRWFTIVLSNSEKSARAISEATNHSRAQGATIRLCDLPIMGEGMDDIFDLCEKADGRIARSKRRLVAIRDGLKVAYGRPIRAFIRSYQKTAAASLVTLKDRRERFAISLVAEDDTPEVQHLIDNFAHIYAAGSLAVDFDILPYSKKQLRKAIRICFKRAKNMMPSNVNLLREAKRTMRQAIDSGRFGRDRSYVDGYIDTNEPRKLVVRVDALKSILHSPMQASLLLASHAEKGRLPKARSVPNPLTDSIQWASSQPTWPNGERPRSIEILFKTPKAHDVDG